MRTGLGCARDNHGTIQESLSLSVRSLSDNTFEKDPRLFSRRMICRRFRSRSRRFSRCYVDTKYDPPRPLNSPLSEKDTRPTRSPDLDETWSLRTILKYSRWHQPIFKYFVHLFVILFVINEVIGFLIRQYRRKLSQQNSICCINIYLITCLMNQP